MIFINQGQLGKFTRNQKLQVKATSFKKFTRKKEILVAFIMDSDRYSVEGMRLQATP